MNWVGRGKQQKKSKSVTGTPVGMCSIDLNEVMSAGKVSLNEHFLSEQLK